MKTLITCMAVLCLNFAFAQQKKTVSYAKIDVSAWNIPNNSDVSYSMGDYRGKNALIMKRKDRNAKAGTLAYPKGVDFKDGIIEADMAWPPDKGGYIGIAFRVQDKHHYDVVYFRPESSGTINAIQYMPAKKADFDWWDYEADKYQAKTTLPLHDWFHIKAIVKGKTLTVFVNNEAKPSMIYKDLDGDLKSGSVGFWFGNSAIAAYRNLTVTTM